jgi:hypothetical protein
MPIPLALPLFISLGFAADEGPSLRTLAAATNRPPECAALARGGKKPSIWQLARLPKLASYCDLVARAHASLGADPVAARKHAEAALAVLPGKAAPHVVVGRVLAQSGDAKGALAAFEEAKKLDPASLDDPKAMYDHARALTQTGRVAEGAALYRVLVSRASLLPEPGKSLVFLQAALATMSAVDTADKKAAALEEAASFVAEARESGGELLPDVVLVSALVFERKGSRERTEALLSEAKRIGAGVDEQARDYIATPADLSALRALDAEVNDPAQAAQAWRAHLADLGPTSPWAATVRTRGAKAAPPPKKPAARKKAAP